MAIVSLKDVVKDYATDGQPVRALDGVSLEVEAGEFVAIVGRSGCGKSTLLHIAGAMDFPTSGKVALDGAEVSRWNDRELAKLRREKIGFIFQSFELLPTLSVAENVELPLLLAGKNQARGRALKRLRWVEMQGLEDRMIHQLSGGQMQRAAIARALVHKPKILLADEPTGNLDNATGSAILELLLRLTKANKLATLMATHSTEAAATADTVVHLSDGRVVEVERKQARK